VLFINKCRCGELFAGKLQAKFGGRRVLTQPYQYSDYNSSDELTFDSYAVPGDGVEFFFPRIWGGPQPIRPASELACQTV
jgi:hypothetical protein